MNDHDALPSMPTETASPADDPAIAGHDGQPEAIAGTAPTNSDLSDLSEVRELILSAYADLVPELVAGDTFDALLASVGPAKAAYERIVASVQAQPATAPRVPAGGGAARQFVVNIEELSASAKIAEGLRQRNRSK